MTRFFNLIIVGFLVAAAIGVYSIKYESTVQSEKVAKLRREIERERVAIAALKAEWSYLAQPDRIDTLSRKYLSLQPMKIDQVIKLSELPEKAPDIDLIAKKLEGLGLSGGPAVTGSTQ